VPNVSEQRHPATHSASPEVPHHDELPPEAMEHPRGTLAIVIIVFALFGLAWLAMYLFVFLERGAPQL
jgi:hypothetical protein